MQKQRIKSLCDNNLPYHTASFNKECIADGLLMGCSKTGKLQPTLEQFYNGIDKEIYEGKDIYHILDPDVSYLAKQGVLMLNAALTTEINKAGSHLDVWEPFMKYIFENIFDVERVPIVFLGKEAAKLKNTYPYLIGLLNYLILPLQAIPLS